jgi:signal transduction histidine kinase
LSPNNINATADRLEPLQASDDVDSMDIGTVFLDRELCVRRFTPAIADLFALGPQDVGRPIDCFAHSIKYDGFLDDLQQVLNHGGPLARQVRNPHGDWFLLRILPYESQVNEASGVVITFTDITALKEVEAKTQQYTGELEAVNARLRETVQQREEAERQAREAVRCRDEFLAMLSHELRTPLGAVQNALHVLGRGEDVELEKRQRAVSVVDRQTQHMVNLLEDLLDVSRVTQRKIKLKRRPLDLRDVVDEALGGVGPMIEARGHRLTVTQCAEPLPVEGDAGRLNQVFSNLLTNAAKYTPNGGNLGVVTEHLDGDAVIRVRDDGVGIRPELLESVFGLFVQSERTRHRADGGMGLGLALVAELVRMHGGTVAAHSEGPNKGCEFVVRLPLLPGSQRPALDGRPPAERIETGRPASPVKALPGGLQIVVIEDDADSRDMLEMLLELDGFQVSVAGDGEEGLAIIREQKPDVAFVDIGLPGIDGYQVAQGVRETFTSQDVCLVALTGYGRPDDVQAALRCGFDDHLTKPLNLEKLADILARRTRRSAE